MSLGCTILLERKWILQKDFKYSFDGIGFRRIFTSQNNRDQKAGIKAGNLFIYTKEIFTELRKSADKATMLPNSKDNHQPFFGIKLEYSMIIELLSQIVLFSEIFYHDLVRSISKCYVCYSFMPTS